MESIELICEDKTRQKKEKKINVIGFRSLISIDKNCAKLEYKQDI